MTSMTQDILAKPYIPIDTDFVDNIEHYATDHIHVQVDYQDRDGSLKSMRGLIAEVYTTKEHEEFLKMADGRFLRLDQLVRVEPTAKAEAGERDRGIDLETKLAIQSRFFPIGLN